MSADADAARMGICSCREGAWTEEEVLRLGREAGEQLKAEAGAEFTNWQH